MAFEKTLIVNSTIGNLKIVIYKFNTTESTTSGTISSPISIRAYSLANSTQQRGTITKTGNRTVSISNLSAGDSGFVILYGY